MERCVFWENGYCRFGDDCKYAHACKTFDRLGKCKDFNNNKCNFFHACKYYDRDGYCRFGDDCKYDHLDRAKS